MISDALHERRLKQADAVIITDYYDNGSVKTRSSDHRKSDDITSGVILAKKYVLHGRLLHQETEFNPGMLYSFVFPKTEDGKIQCPNCGGIGDDALFSDGCPYCGAFYNMEYQSEILGKRDHADYVSARRKGLFLPLVVILSVCIAGGIFFFGTTGRTSTFFDYGKGALIGSLAGGMIYLVYGAFRSRASLTSEEIRKKHEQEIVLERFREDLDRNGLSMSDFINSLNLGLRDYWFGSESEETADIIDFDILDYRDQQVTSQDGAVTISTEISLRLIRANADRIWSKETTKRIRLRKQKRSVRPLMAGANMTTCPHCGASIDLTEDCCGYCGTPFPHERVLTIEAVSG